MSRLRMDGHAAFEYHWMFLAVWQAFRRSPPEMQMLCYLTQMTSRGATPGTPRFFGRLCVFVSS